MPNAIRGKYRNDHHIYKKFYGPSATEIFKLFKPGLIEDLVQHRLVPPTSILSSNDGRLVLRQKRIKTLTYPHEWSFSMLKDAAVCTLKVNKIANNYGYQLQDAHPFNVVFDELLPKFVDIGSFIRLAHGSKGWFGQEEYMRTFYYPLWLWSKGLVFISYSTLLSTLKEMPHSEFIKIKYPLTNLVPNKIFNLASKYYYPLSKLTAIDPEFLQTRLSPFVFKIVSFLIRSRLLPFQGYNYQRLLENTERLRNPSNSYWGSYENRFISKADKRFFTIIGKLKNRKISSMIDLGSNQGNFSILAIKKAQVKSSVCIDSDESAIDKLYNYLKGKNIQLIPVRQNVIYPVVEGNQKQLHERFKAEAVVALALTHHLLLSQNIPLDRILKSIARLSTKYVFVEFMPLGLWNGKTAPPTPGWYNQKWFERNFRKHFSLEEIERLGENRILFVGRLKAIKKTG